MHRPVAVGGLGSRCTPFVVLTIGGMGGLLSSDAASLLRWTSMVTELEEVPMSIVGGLDIHRKQLTFDWVDEQNGKWERGRISVVEVLGRGLGAEWEQRLTPICA